MVRKGKVKCTIALNDCYPKIPRDERGELVARPLSEKNGINYKDQLEVTFCLWNISSYYIQRKHADTKGTGTACF